MHGRNDCQVRFQGRRSGGGWRKGACPVTVHQWIVLKLGMMHRISTIFHPAGPIGKAPRPLLGTAPTLCTSTGLRWCGVVWWGRGGRRWLQHIVLGPFLDCSTIRSLGLAWLFQTPRGPVSRRRRHHPAIQHPSAHPSRAPSSRQPWCLTFCWRALHP